MEIRLEGVRFDRDRRRVIDIPSLRLRNGATTAILGPNGSGKTTLLRLIAGLERPQTGEVRVGGAPVRRGQPLAYVFQEQVFLRRSVRENLELGLRLRGVPSSHVRSRIEDALRLLDIPHLIDRRADRLSGGEGRRVSLARALSLRAPLVLLDEPLEGLDQSTHARLLGELPTVLAAFAATTVLVTHDRDEALRLADDLVVIVDGQVQAAGHKRDVATNPRTAAVAQVLGYVVVAVDGRRFAVPPRLLAMGAGAWTMDVESVLDLVERQEVVGRIGTSPVRVPIDRDATAPAPGERISVGAERAYDIE